jgi:error-prone DNA polymerase
MTAASSAFAELAVATNFSFLRGASRPEELVVAAAVQGHYAIGIADRNSLAGVVRAYDALEQLKAGIIPGDSGELPETLIAWPKLLVGARLVFKDDIPDILAYPVDRESYGRLCRLISRGKLRAEKGDCTLFFDDLVEFHDGLLLAVIPPQRTILNSTSPNVGRSNRRSAQRVGGSGGGPSPPIHLKAVLARLTDMAEGRVYLTASMLHHGDDKRRLKRLRTIARECSVPLLAINDVLYHAPGRRALADVVTCIREHVTLAAAGRLLEANAERHLKPPAEMARLFRDAPDAIAETIRFAGRIGFSLDQLKYNYPEEPVPKGKSPQGHLEDLTWEGAAARYPNGIPEKVRAAIEKELALIAKLEYAPYFLTVRDIVGFANARKILCQGRGSAANSAVCFALGITGVDPNAIDLLFERFISQERKEPPDIDVDFEHERREEVIQDVYKRYGHEHAAITATVISYRPRSAIREVGKVFGLTEDVTAALAGSVWGSGGSEYEEREVRQGDFDPNNATIARAVAFANALIGFPRHLSQHVGGFVLTRDRLDTIVPIGPAAMADRYFIEWDKDDIDRLGIMKVDVLALGMLTCIRKAFELIAANGGERYDLATVPREDSAVYDMLCKADAIGVFQVESRAQMNMLPRLRPREFYDLVIEVAIVRPGPIQGDMVHPYLRRRSGAETIVYPSPSPEHGPHDELLQVLGKTMGVPLFQEQAMRLAIVAAKFTPEEANGLRRSMATFRHSGTIHTFGEKMVGNMVARGYSRDFAERCFHQIEGFGTYGFPESHAASFAHLVYISAWIKCHHPAAFACALLNSQPMGFYAPAEIVRDAREHGVEARAPDINASFWDNTLERDNDGALALRLGLRQITGFREAWAKTLVEARAGAFASIDELRQRTSLPKAALILLAEADAFRSLGLDRREALWAVRRLKDEPELPLFAALDAGEQPEETIAPLPPMPLSEHVIADYQSLRLSLKAYPTQFLREMFTREAIMSCAEVGAGRDGERARVAGIVLVRQMPGTAGVVFITLSDETGICNVVVWPSMFARFRKEAMGARLLLVEGKIQRSPEGVVHLVAEKMIDRTGDLSRLSEDEPQRRSTAADNELHRHPRQVRVLPKSRDFH